MNTMEEKLVEVTGLERNVDLNGKQGTILDYDPKSDRFIICINDEKWKVKLANIKTVDAVFERRNRVFHIGAPPPRNTARRRSRPTARPKPKKEECAICMEEMSGEVTLKCGHRMCPLRPRAYRGRRVVLVPRQWPKGGRCDVVGMILPSPRPRTQVL